MALNQNHLADVIILARGGGSLEDLWPFNEDIVARAMNDSEIPIISAVGHETDFTISDFVSDLRAPTPSAAAELANIDVYELKNKIQNLRERLRINLNKKIDLSKLKLKTLEKSKAFAEPLTNIQNNYLKIDKYIKQMESKVILKQKEAEKEFKALVSKLDALSPLKTLSRGYIIAEKDKKLIKSYKDLNKNDKVTLTFVDGTKDAVIDG